MKKIILIIISAVFINAEISFCTGIHYFRSAQSGNWNSLIWEGSENGISWGASGIYPVSTDNDTISTITIRTGHHITVVSDIEANALIIERGAVLTIDSGYSLTISSDFSYYDMQVDSSALINGSGTLRTSTATSAVNIGVHKQALFSAKTEVVNKFLYLSPLYPDISCSFYNDLIVSEGAGVYFLNNPNKYFVYGDIISSGKIITGGSLLIFKGDRFTNNDTCYADTEMDTNSIIDGDGIWKGVYLFIKKNKNVVLGSDVHIENQNFALEKNSVLNLNNHELIIKNTGLYSALIMDTNSSVINSNRIRTKGNIYFYCDSSANLQSDLLIDSGAVTEYHNSLNYVTVIDGKVTINYGALFQINYTSIFNNNLTINPGGKLNGIKAVFNGDSLTNNGAITLGEFFFNSNCLLKGNGSWNNGVQSYVYINPSTVVTLGSDWVFSGPNFEINTGGTLYLNGYTFFASKPNTIIYTNLIFKSGSVLTSPGTVKIDAGNYGYVNIDNRNGSDFNSTLNLRTGITYAYSLLSLEDTTKFNGNIIIDSGAVLSSNSYGDKLRLNNDLLNNGTLSINCSFFGNNFENNGTVNSALFTFSVSNQILTGNGKFVNNYCIVNNGSSVTMNSDHQLHKLKIYSGGSFNISGRTLKLTGNNYDPIENNGVFNTSESTVEFNNISLTQIIPVANVNYNSITINNPSGIFLVGNLTIPETLSVYKGDLDLNGYVITLSPSATLAETSGNTVSGNYGYITTTRNINAPSNLNIGGVGAVLTTNANLGLTEIRRGHAYQFGLGEEDLSIKRYFDILPSLNSGLNAVLKFKYDPSETEYFNEDSIGLYRSTDGGNEWNFRGGVTDTSENSITLSGVNSFSRWSAGVATGPSAAEIKLIPEGILNTITWQLNRKDTVFFYLASSVSPYNNIDSSKTTADSVNYICSPVFSNASSGNYYIIAKHRNSIETWSRAGGEVYESGQILQYDFTSSQSQAYGNNLLQKGILYCIYSGDVNQDGTVDLADVTEIENDAFNFVSGYVVTDVNGDGAVDIADQTIADNNSFNFVSLVRP